MNRFWTYLYNGLFMGVGLGTVFGAMGNLATGHTSYILMFYWMVGTGIIFMLLLWLFMNMVVKKQPMSR